MEEELYCLNCDKELPEDNFCSHNALILTDEREQVSEVIGVWCDEKCMAEWLVKNGLRGKLAQIYLLLPVLLDTMKKQMTAEKGGEK